MRPAWVSLRGAGPAPPLVDCAFAGPARDARAQRRRHVAASAAAVRPLAYADGMARSIYLHVPFCPHVCPYCDFHKMLRNEGLVARYLDRLEQEALAQAERHPGRPDTVYFGGGTPSHLSDAELERVVAVLDRTFGFPGRLETTLEADPLTFTPDRLARFRDLGFDRLSIGLQSTQDQVLRYLGRVHDGREGLQALDWALASGLRVNADIITAVPGQDAELDLRTVAGTGVEHMSVYTLTVEPGTPFALRGVTIDPEREANDFELVAGVLAPFGLERYEVSNFARPGQESRHNLGTWRGETYLGLGPSASSHLPEGGPFGMRLRNPTIRAWLEGAAPERELLGPEDVVLERLLTGLRTREGVDLTALERRTGRTPATMAPRWWRDALRHRLLTVDGDRLRATDAGLARLDALLRSFVRAPWAHTVSAHAERGP